MPPIRRTEFARVLVVAVLSLLFTVGFHLHWYLLVTGHIVIPDNPANRLWYGLTVGLPLLAGMGVATLTGAWYTYRLHKDHGRSETQLVKITVLPIMLVSPGTLYCLWVAWRFLTR